MSSWLWSSSSTATLSDTERQSLQTKGTAALKQFQQEWREKIKHTPFTKVGSQLLSLEEKEQMNDDQALMFQHVQNTIEGSMYIVTHYPPRILTSKKFETKFHESFPDLKCTVMAVPNTPTSRTISITYKNLAETEQRMEQKQILTSSIDRVAQENMAKNQKKSKDRKKLSVCTKSFLICILILSALIIMILGFIAFGREQLLLDAVYSIVDKK